MQADGNPIEALPEDPSILRALLLSTWSQRDKVVAERNALAEQNEHLKHLVQKLTRLKFGAKSERWPEDQLQLSVRSQWNSTRIEDETASGSVPRTPDTRHCDAASPGTGKSWLACALGQKACREDFSTIFYHRVPRLFSSLALARADGRYARVLRQIARTDLLILDDWGPETLTAEQRRDLLEIIDDRHEMRSVIITS